MRRLHAAESVDEVVLDDEDVDAPGAVEGEDGAELEVVAPGLVVVVGPGLAVAAPSEVEVVAAEA